MNKSIMSTYQSHQSSLINEAVDWIYSLLKPEIMAELKCRGQVTVGNKAMLVTRLEEVK